MYTLFERRLVSGDTQRDVALTAGTAGWLPAQEHQGENIRDIETRVILVELKEPAPSGATGQVGPVVR